MQTNVCIHLEEEDLKPEVLVREKYTVINLGKYSEQSLFFKSEEHLRSFAESILQQLVKVEVESV